MKVENTRVRRGSRLAAAIRPPITLASAAGSCPSSASSWYSKPPLVESPMIGGRLNGRILACRICDPAAKRAPDRRLHRIRRGLAIRKRFHARHHECRIRLVAAVEQRKADDRQHVLDLRHLLQQRFDLLGDLAGAGYRRAVRQLYRDEEGALVFFGQKSGRRQTRDAEDARRQTPAPATSDSTAIRSSRRTPLA